LNSHRDELPDPLPPELAAALDAARDRLGPAPFHYFREIGSTNDVACSLAGAGAPDGTAVLADGQSSGRGRRGRVWFSPPGAGIYLSCIVRRVDDSPSLALLSLAAGIAAAAAVRAVTGLPVELKWPNDVVVGRPWRKLGGILCETAGPAHAGAVVVGTGVNVQPAAYPPELRDRATSIETEVGRAIDRTQLAVEILVLLRDEMARLREGAHARVLEEWRRLGRAGLADEPVRWQDQSGQRRGVAKDIDDRGALIVSTEGRIERLIAGEVTWDRMS
jgi:BirA family biotin operon repressor/biotin-[acetyl-CoA-carboxylase] ligase